MVYMKARREYLFVDLLVNVNLLSFRPPCIFLLEISNMKASFSYLPCFMIDFSRNKHNSANKVIYNFWSQK